MNNSIGACGLALCAAVVLAVLPFASHAQYPGRAIKMILPFAPGGGGDTFARPLAQALSESLGQPVVVENIVGGAAIVGTQTASRAPADGYTILMVSNAHAINEGLHDKLGYNLFKDFVPITQLCSFSIALVVHPSLEARSVAELISIAKSRPGKLSYASSGIGSIYHLPMELLKSMAGVDIVHIPHKSSGTARADLLAGRVEVMFDGLATMQSFIDAQRVRIIGVAGATRSPAAPDVPAIAETMPGFEGDAWLGYLAPAGTPQPIIVRLQTEIVKYISQPQVRTSYHKQAAEPVGSSPAEFGSFLRREVEKWGRVIKISGAKSS
jgi:tripartite-type tricarboxylate transporter receptor subunit TctC